MSLHLSQEYSVSWRNFPQPTQRRLLFLWLPRQDSGRASERRPPGSAQIPAQVDEADEHMAPPETEQWHHSLPQITSLNISLLISLISMHQGLAVWKKKGTEWKEKGT